MFTTSKNIWLIDMGGEITWCDCPDLSDGVSEEDVIGYVRADIYGKLEQANAELVKALREAAKLAEYDGEAEEANKYRATADKYEVKE